MTLMISYADKRLHAISLGKIIISAASVVMIGSSFVILSAPTQDNLGYVGCFLNDEKNKRSSITRKIF